MQQEIADLLKHEVFSSVRTRHLFTMSLKFPPPVSVGQTPNGCRVLALVTGGDVIGDRVRGTVIGGNDWLVVRPDGSFALDVRLAFRCESGAVVTMSYHGLRQGPPAILQKLERGEEVDPASYYLRIAPLFETADPALAWLNGVVAIGIGHSTSKVPVLYNVFEVL
jgi:Protein of unknown function (DUF3237)